MSEGVCKEKLFKSIFWEYAETLRNVIYYKIGDMEIAEELVSMAFTELWDNCTDVTVDESKDYIYDVANKLLLKHSGSNKLALNREPKHAVQTNMETQELLVPEKEQKLHDAISNLPIEQRVVFLMNRIDKNKYSDIAAVLDTSTQQIEKQMHEALATLKNLNANS